MPATAAPVDAAVRTWQHRKRSSEKSTHLACRPVKLLESLAFATLVFCLVVILALSSLALVLRVPELAFGGAKFALGSETAVVVELTCAFAASLVLARLAQPARPLAALALHRFAVCLQRKCVVRVND